MISTVKKHILFELKKMKKTKWIIIYASFIIQLLFLYFFIIVGRFESSSTDDILKNYSSIIGLATTITICIITIYGTVIINRIIVINYIGDNRMRLYLYPCGRGKLYWIKNISFVITFSFMQLLGLTLANMFFLVIESIFPLLNSQSIISTYLITFIISSIVAIVLTIAIILFSSIVGIYFKSTISTIITGLILILFSGNIIAIAFINDQYITLIGTLVILILAFWGIKITEMKINNSEVL